MLLTSNYSSLTAECKKYMLLQGAQIDHGLAKRREIRPAPCPLGSSRCRRPRLFPAPPPCVLPLPPPCSASCSAGGDGSVPRPRQRSLLRETSAHRDTAATCGEPAGCASGEPGGGDDGEPDVGRRPGSGDILPDARAAAPGQNEPSRLRGPVREGRAS